MYSSEFKTIILIILIISCIFYLKISTVEKMTDDTSLSQVNLTAIRNLGNIAAEMVDSTTNTLTLPYNVKIEGNLETDDNLIVNGRTTLNDNMEVNGVGSVTGNLFLGVKGVNKWVLHAQQQDNGLFHIARIPRDSNDNWDSGVKIFTNANGDGDYRTEVNGNLSISGEYNLGIREKMINLAYNTSNTLEFRIKAVNGPRAGQYINYSSVSVNNYRPDNNTGWKISIGSGRTGYRWLPKTDDNPGTIFKFVPHSNWASTKKGKLYAKDLPLRTGWSSVFTDGDNSELVSSTNNSHVYDSRMFINFLNLLNVNHVTIKGHTNNEILGIENSGQPSVVGLSSTASNQYILELEFV